jgi:IclR family acetate operon transcriptional repressor
VTVQGRPTLIASVQRALRLLEAASRHERGAPAKQLARETGLPLATTYHLLRTLIEEGYVQKMEGGAFVLGEGVNALHGRSRGQMELRRIRPALTALRDELSAAVYLCLYQDGEIKVIDIADAPRAPRVDMWVGFNEAAHATASGKAVLRAMDEEATREFISRHPMADLTPRTITRAADLLRNIETPGPMVLDREEYMLGVSCAAVPISDGKQVASLGISFPTRRLHRHPAMGQPLVRAAEQVARGLSLTM